MNYENNIGIAFSSNYLKQGDNIEKCKVSKKNKVPNILLNIREDKKYFNIPEDKKIYNGNIIYNIPPVSYNLNNMKLIEEIVSKLSNNKINMITMNPSNLKVSDYEWSTKNEQDIILNNITESIASIASNKIIVALENPVDTKEKIYLGHDIKQMSDILVKSRKVLIDKYKFTESDAKKYIKVCINTSKQSINDLDKWFNSFNDSIECIKIKNDNTTYDYVINYIKLNKFSKNLKILLNTNSDLENVINEYNLFKRNFISGNKRKQENEKINNKSSNKYADMVQIGIIIITIFIAFLMIYVKFYN